MIMRKKIKLPLEMADGVKVRTLDELKDNWSLEKVVENYLNGRLATWLNDRYYTELAEQVDALAKVQDNTALQKELCRIFDVDFEDEEDIDVDAVNERNRKLDVLRQYTADDTILKNVDIVAFDQEELGDILDAGENIIYLFNNTFSVPLSVKNKKYIGIGKVECIIHSKDVVDFTELGIEFENVVFDSAYAEVEKSKIDFYEEGTKLYSKGEYEKAIEFYKKAIDAGNGAAAADLGNMYHNADGVERNYDEALKYFRRGAELGNRVATGNVGHCYRWGHGVAQDYVEAMKWLKKSSDMGSSWAMNVLGDMYFYGEGVEKNYDEALKYFRKGAEAGNNNAIANVGYMYCYGKGVEQNFEEAMKWYRKAADGGNAWAMSEIGDLYHCGNGVEQNYEEALKYYRKGAELGGSSATRNVGYCYYWGRGVAKDYVEAMKWYRKAAEAGDYEAMAKVGDMYNRGEGVAQNEEEAKKWYKKAADGGNEWAKGQLSRLGY